MLFSQIKKENHGQNSTKTPRPNYRKTGKHVPTTLVRMVLGSGKALATIAGNWEEAAEKYERGYNLVIYMSDCVTLGQVARERAGAFKRQYGGI